MSIYAIYDSNFFNTSLPYFNLECGKLLSYLRRNNHIAVLNAAPDPELFKEVIIRKEIEDGSFLNFFKATNARLEGRGFTKFYKPMNMEIERTKPIFDDYIKFSGLKEPQKFSLQLNAVHVRLSLDEKTVWPDYQVPLDFEKKKTIFVHDKNLTKIEGAREALKEIKWQKNTPYVSFLYPIEFDTIDELVKWQDLSFGSDAFIYLNFLPEVKEYGSIIDNLFLKIGYNLTGTPLEENENFILRLEKFYRYAMKMRTQGYKILLIYDKEKIKDQELKYLLPYISSYFAGKCDEPFYNWMRNKEKHYEFDTDSFLKYHRIIRQKDRKITQLFKVNPKFYQGE